MQKIQAERQAKRRELLSTRHHKFYNLQICYDFLLNQSNMFDKPSSKLFSHSLSEWFSSKKRLQVTKSHNLRHPKQIGNILQI